MSEPSASDRATDPAPSFQMVGSDEAPVCEDGICVVPTNTAVAVSGAERAAPGGCTPG